MNIKFLQPTFKKFHQSEITTRAAALSYHTILAIVPAIGLIFLYLQKIGITDELLKNLQDYILSHINVGSSQAFLKTYTKLTRQVQGHSWGWIGMIVLIYTTHNLLIKLGNSIDAILQSAEVEWDFSKNFFRIISRRFIVLLGLPVAIMCSSFLTALFRKGSWINKLLIGQDYILTVVAILV
jgi:uncharacterized BrkB/YihY/UPF0761 family membrane protein